MQKTESANKVNHSVSVGPEKYWKMTIKEKIKLTKGQKCFPVLKSPNKAVSSNRVGKP